MDIKQWLSKRNDRTSLAWMARQLWMSGHKYSELEIRLRQEYIVEALIANGGNQRKTAQILGIHYNTVYRAVRMIGISITDVQEMAKAAKESNGR